MEEQKATHVAIPLETFQAVGAVLGTLPYSQVQGLIAALNKCQPLAIPEDAKIGDTVGEKKGS